MKKLLTGTSVALLLGVSSAPLHSWGFQGAFPLYFNCDGWHDRTLQALIDKVPAGSTIFVKGNCVGPFGIGKDIELVGFGPTRATLSASPDGGPVLAVNAARLSLRSLDVDGGGFADGVVANIGSIVTLRDVVVKNTLLGMWLGHASVGDIAESMFVDNNHGINTLQGGSLQATQLVIDGGETCIRVERQSNVAFFGDGTVNTIMNCSTGLDVVDGFVFLFETTFENNGLDVVCGPGGVIDSPGQLVPPEKAAIDWQCRAINLVSF